MREGKNKRERVWREGREKGREVGKKERNLYPIDFLFLGTKELCLDPSWSKLMRPVTCPICFSQYSQILCYLLSNQITDLIFIYKHYAVVQLLRCVQLFTIPWAVARQVSLSMGFPRQGNWNGLPFPTLGHLPNPRIESTSLELASRLISFQCSSVQSLSRI